MKNIPTFKYTKISGPLYDCECCGSYSAEGKEIYVNGELVWRKYFDGHLGGDQTEDSILNCVTKKWHENNIKAVQEQHSEDARDAWNKKYPGNGVARTVESWAEKSNDIIDFHNDCLENILESCKNLPYDELLQIKMIAIWIESRSGERIEIVESSYYEESGHEDFGYYGE